VLSRLKAARVDMHVVSAFPAEGGRAQLVLVPKKPEALARAAAAAGLELHGPQPALLVQGSDRSGACEGIFRKLAAADVNMHAAQAIAAGERRFGMILWAKKGELERAAKALGAV